MARAGAHGQDDGVGGHRAKDEPSVSSAIEHLVVSSQGVITKRIDLALLEGHELVSSTLRRAALIGLAMVLGAGAWFAAAACVVLSITPDANPVLRLAAFGLLNAGAALGLVALAARGRPQTPVGANKNVSRQTDER